jgi:hypothetical protein
MYNERLGVASAVMMKRVTRVSARSQFIEDFFSQRDIFLLSTDVPFYFARVRIARD